MEAKILFKKLINDARSPIRSVDDIMSFGSQRESDFEKGKRPSQDGRFSHLTDEYIDGLNDAELEREMVVFIYKCFQQR